jgi:hypothetical protein
LPSGWTIAEAGAINSLGQVAGSVIAGTAEQSFIGTPAGSVVIPLPPSGPCPNCYIASSVAAVNDAGQVAETVFAFYGNYVAFIGTPAGNVFVPLPTGWTGAYSFCQAVNNSGQVAGYLTGSTGPIFFGTTAGTTLVPSPSGSWSWQSSGLANVALNDPGQIVANGSLLGHNQVFIGTPSAATAIPLPSAATYATIGPGSLNNSGAVVGQSDAGGWIWDATNGTRLLNSLVQPGWSVSKGISISNSGLILAQASYQGGASQYVELVSAGLPGTPAPSTLILVLIGAIFCAILFHASRGVSRPLL